METKEFICTVCPNSCSLIVQLGPDGGVEQVAGNRCPRGAAFARQDAVCPVRVLTSTVLIRSEDGSEALLPVRSSGPFALSQHARIMELLRHMTVRAPVRMGDVVLPNLLGTGVDLIASCDSFSRPKPVSGPAECPQACNGTSPSPDAIPEKGGFP